MRHPHYLVLSRIHRALPDFFGAMDTDAERKLGLSLDELIKSTKKVREQKTKVSRVMAYNPYVSPAVVRCHGM